MRVVLKVHQPGREYRILQEERLFTTLAAARPARRWPALLASLTLQAACVASLLEVSDQVRLLREAELEARVFYVQTSAIRLVSPVLAVRAQAAGSGPDPEARRLEAPAAPEAPEIAAQLQAALPEALQPVIEAAAPPPARRKFVPRASNARLEDPPLILEEPAVLPASTEDLLASPVGSMVAVAGAPPAELPLHAGPEGAGASTLARLVRPLVLAFASSPREAQTGDGPAAELRLARVLATATQEVSRGVLGFASRLFTPPDPAECNEESGRFDQLLAWFRGRPASDPGAHRLTPRLDRTIGEDTGAAPVPPGAIHLLHPPDGTHDLVVVHSSPRDAFPGFEPVLSGGPVYSVRIPVGYAAAWNLNYCLPANPGGGAPGGETAPPYPLETLVPPNRLAGRLSGLLIRGYVNAEGRFEHLEPVHAPGANAASHLLEYLAAWRFRPAARNGSPVTVEAALLIP